MKRTVDPRKTSKALRKLRRAAAKATDEGGPGLTNWEQEFVEGVTGRLETYGSAFRDPGKGNLEDALSQRQAQIVRVIDKKARKRKAAAQPGEKKPPAGEAESRQLDRGADDKPRSTFKRRSPMRTKAKPGRGPRVRDVNDDMPPDEPAPPARGRPSLTVITGGKQR